MRKVWFTGTQRVRLPEATLAAITPLLPDYGVARPTEVTDLDRLGVPLALAERQAPDAPAALGGGATPALAKIAAAMTAIERWHAAHAVPAPALRDVAERALDLPYPATEQVPDEDPAADELLTDDSPLDWIEAESLLSGKVTMLPRRAVTPSRVAAGNSVAEASAHALYEAIERDTLSARHGVPADERVLVDPSSVDDPCGADLIGRVLAAGARLELEYVPGALGVPCVLASLWHEDAAAPVAFGSAAHIEPAVALARAVIEAARSRMSFVLDRRGDGTSAARRSGVASPPMTAGHRWSWHEVTGGAGGLSLASDIVEVGWLTERVTAMASYEPLRVVLTDRPELAVVAVACPGLRRDMSTLYEAHAVRA
jgi:ribosomal protein S12 methylthiotransferase accessory factor